MESAFIEYQWTAGVLASFPDAPFPSSLSAWDNGECRLGRGATHFGFCWDGEAVLHCASGDFRVASNMYFSVPGPASVRGEGRGIVVSRLGFEGLFALGGPIEEKGRLRYIDGCTDSLLIAPVMMGDPCLNLLHIPPDTRQTQHTHPSLRAGIIVSGSGKCVTPEGEHLLAPGTVFVIPAGGKHSFHTGNGEPLRVIAYHPDSDFGPTHQNHPMVNRTIIEPSRA